MIPLARLPLQTAEDVSATRNKILGLTRALHFDMVPATRIAVAVSEQIRLLLASGKRPELRISLEERSGYLDLVLRFWDEQTVGRAPGVSELFDIVQLLSDSEGNGRSLVLRVVTPLLGTGADPHFLQRERSRLARKTRTQLMEELQQKNAQLEKYASQLEQMVADRTAELRQAYDKMKHDLETAAAYVRRLIPPPCETPVVADWKYIPSAELGGDIFGYHAIDGEHLAIYLLDVTGHGVDSALLAVSVVNVIRSASLPGVDCRCPGQVLEGLNEAFPMEKFGDKMFTIWYGVFNHATRSLRWSGGGHPEALLYSAGEKTPRRLDSFGPMMGMIQGVPFEEGECSISSPARLFIYSDGVFEICKLDGVFWTSPEFVEYLSQISDSEEPLQTLLNHVRQLRGADHLDDDFSIMEVRF